MKKSKIVSLALAGTLTATALLAGTYAWQSISQRATNEAVGDVNPGARLHDDFDGTNKDIYVENFTSNEDGADGAVIYARIKLAEYLEIGDKAVKQKDTDNPDKADPSTWTTFKLADEDSSKFRYYYDWTWGGGTDYMPTFNKNKDSLEADINGTFVGPDRNRNERDDVYADYTDYTAGDTEFGLEIYDIDGDTRDEDEYVSEEIIKALHNGSGGFATNFYNKANGTAITEGESIDLPAIDITGDPILDDNGQPVKYTATVIEVTEGKDASGNTTGVIEAVTLNIVRADKDSENNTDEEVETDGAADVRVSVVKDADGNITQHTAASTLNTEGVISMEEWIARDCEPGAYWVYDNTDGWAYWAQGIQPGTATGCLLTGIDRNGTIVDEYYYAINVTAEFATAGDWGEGTVTEVDDDGKLVVPTDGTGFYKNGITVDGLYLLNTIAGAEKDLFIDLPEDYKEATGIEPGETLELGASVKLGGQTISGDAVTWTVTNHKDTTGTTITSTAVAGATLTVGEKETAKYVTVTASLRDMPQVTTSRQIAIGDVYTVTVDETVSLAAENVKEVTLRATVKDQRGDDNYDGVTWALDGDYTGVDIDPDTGKLTITDEVEAGSIQVKATSKADQTKSDTGTITVKSQLEYISTLTVDTTPGKQPIVKVDGIEWYVLRKDDVSGDEVADALLWSVEPVEGWQRGDSVTVDGKSTFYGWKYYDPSNPFKYDSTKDPWTTGGENWWRYSNVRAWLNSEGTDDGYPVYDDDGHLITSTDGLSQVTYDGFLKGKTILSENAVPTTIYTRKEFDLTGEETDFDVVGGTPENPGDKVFIFTQADIYGTASGKVDDGTGTLVYKSDADPVKEDYTVDENLHNEISASMRATSDKWYWLRSPRDRAGNVAIVTYGGGSVGLAGYLDSRGYVRPALWLNLTSSGN